VNVARLPDEDDFDRGLRPLDSVSTATTAAAIHRLPSYFRVADLIPMALFLLRASGYVGGRSAWGLAGHVHEGMDPDPSFGWTWSATSVGWLPITMEDGSSIPLVWLVLFSAGLLRYPGTLSSERAVPGEFIPAANLSSGDAVFVRQGGKTGICPCIRSIKKEKLSNLERGVFSNVE